MSTRPKWIDLFGIDPDYPNSCTDETCPECARRLAIALGLPTGDDERL